MQVLTIIFFFFTLILFSSSKTIIEQNCIQKDLPQKFGIITTTFIRHGSIKILENYLQLYAQSDCPLYDNIYIVWNNHETPQELGALKNKHLWKKKVYFLQTIYNSLDFKYIVPPWAPEKVFFSMDDDFGITCQALTEGFEKWKLKSSGQVGPLASIYPRLYQFDVKSQRFSYYLPNHKQLQNLKYYNFGLTGIAFISRHFLDLYYSEIFEIKTMRKQVALKNNCEDLLMNFMISSLYPELVPQILNISVVNFGQWGVSSTKNHFKFRDQCIKKFTQIIGYNPVKFILKVPNQYVPYRSQSPQSCLISIKEQFYYQNYLSPKTGSKFYEHHIKRVAGSQNGLINLQNQHKRLIDAKKDVPQYSDQMSKLSRKEFLDKYLLTNKIFPLTNEDLQILNQYEIELKEKNQKIEKLMIQDIQKKLQENLNLFKPSKNQKKDKMIFNDKSQQKQQINKIQQNQINKQINTIENKNIEASKQSTKSQKQQKKQQLIDLNPKTNVQEELISSNSFQSKIYYFCLMILSILGSLFLKKKCFQYKQSQMQRSYQEVSNEVKNQLNPQD